MSTNAALGASGLSFALGVMNARNLNSLTEDVENMKKSMVPAKDASIDNPELDTELESDLAAIDSPSDLNRKSIADVITRVQELEESLEGISASSGNVTTLEGSVKSLNSQFSALNAEVQETLFDVETVAALEPSIQDLLKNWKALSTRASVTEAGVFNAESSKIGMLFNNGDQTGLHFAGNTNASWTMYGSSSSGKGPDGKAPPSHAGVKGNAIRVRVGAGATDGFIVENGNRQGVFSVGSDGKTTMGNMMSGALTGDVSAISNTANFNAKGYALAQKKDGTTFVNTTEGRTIQFLNGGVLKGYFEGSPNRTLTLKNGADAGDTHFNHEGHNYIRCGAEKSTMFRVGKNALNRLSINKNGTEIKGSFYLDGSRVDDTIKGTAAAIDRLNASIKSLEGRVKDIETYFIDSRRRIHLRNHIANKYIGSGGDVDSSKSSSHSRFSIEH